MNQNTKAQTWQKLIVAGVVLAGLFTHIRSFDIFFFNDDLQILQQFVSSASFQTWLFARVVDHIILIPKLFYSLFFAVFGLTAVPWHLLILSVHSLNILLLYLILKKSEVSFPSRVFALGCFAITTVFHECIYWVGASTFLFCLPFCLGAVLAARYAEERRSYVGLFGVSIFVSLALFSVSTGVVATILTPLSLFSMPRGAWSKTRAVASTFLFALLGVLPYFAVASFVSDTMNGIGSSALTQFDPITATIFTARSIIERLAARYFTGGSLPTAVSLTVFATLVLVVIATPFHRAESRFKRLVAPVSWIVIPTWLILSFRSWMGDVVFVSRYQLLPAVGFTWLLALTMDDALGVLLRWQTSRRLNTMLLIAFSGLFAVQAYASYVCHQRWLERTEGLKNSHQQIAAALRSLIHGSTEPLVLTDHLIGGGQGWRPSLRGLTEYTLSAEEQKNIRFRENAPDLKYGLDPKLLPLVDELRAGKQNWLTWIDDLSISKENYSSANAVHSGNEIILNAQSLFPERTGARFNFDRNGNATIDPYGIGYPAELTTSVRQDISLWTTVHLNLQSKNSGEVLISFANAAQLSPDLGARLRLPAEMPIKIAIDVPLAARGPVTGSRIMKIAFTDLMTSYKVGPITVSCRQSCK